VLSYSCGQRANDSERCIVKPQGSCRVALLLMKEYTEDVFRSQYQNSFLVPGRTEYVAGSRERGLDKEWS